MWFSADTNTPHNQAVKHVIKYLKETAIQGIVLKPYPEKGIECQLLWQMEPRRRYKLCIGSI